jgi:hypothetical protein
MAVTPKEINEKQLAEMMVDFLPFCRGSRYLPIHFTLEQPSAPACD